MILFSLQKVILQTFNDILKKGFGFQKHASQDTVQGVGERGHLPPLIKNSLEFNQSYEPLIQGISIFIKSLVRRENMFF